MKLEAGAMRELHRDAPAAGWGFVIAGNVRTTVAVRPLPAGGKAEILDLPGIPEA